MGATPFSGLFTVGVRKAAIPCRGRIRRDADCARGVWDMGKLFTGFSRKWFAHILPFLTPSRGVNLAHWFRRSPELKKRRRGKGLTETSPPSRLVRCFFARNTSRFKLCSVDTSQYSVRRTSPLSWSGYCPASLLTVHCSLLTHKQRRSCYLR
jgi:hypothetical protein